MMLREMVLASIAWYKALRTRTSFSGFLPLMFEPGNSSRNWSMPRKMVRFSTPSTTFKSGLARKRPKSWGVGSSTMSTSPDSKAATRVAADLMGV